MLNADALESLTDQALVERLLPIYKEVVTVPMYYKAITNQPELARPALLYLLASDDDLEKKVNAVRTSRGKHYIKGLGKTFWSVFFMALNPQQNPYWNNRTEKALKDLGMDAWLSKDSPGQVYLKISDAEHYLADLHPEADLYGIDHFMYHVTVDAGYETLKRWRGIKTKQVIPRGDDLATKIRRWQEEHIPPERISVRQEAEGEAADLLTENLGRFDEGTLRQFFELVNTDLFAGQPRRNRFSPAFVGANVNRIVEQLDLFNEWAARLWEASPDKIEEVLDLLWSEKPISYAGTSLPTLLLYLHEPAQYNLWLGPLAEGLKSLIGFEVGRESGGNYLRYNEEVNRLKEAYDLKPQEMDVILVVARRELVDEPEQQGHDGTPQHFQGFTIDTFGFLSDLQINNTKVWLQANREKYQDVLREPLRALFKDLAPLMAQLDPNFETEAKYGKVMATIKRRWPGDTGPYHPYLWGAFYRANLSKQTDAQLFVVVHPSMVSVGLGVGISAKDALNQFRENLQAHSELLYQLVRPLMENGFVVTGAESHGEAEKETLEIYSPDDVKSMAEYDNINIERYYTPKEDIVYRPEFAKEIGDIFKSIYPLYRFFVSPNITAELDRLLPGEEEVEEIEEEREKYTLVDLEKDTYLDADYLQRIETLIREKGQIILYGPPGTGKTYVAKRFAQYFVDQSGGNVRIVQFHPSYSYEEFIEGIRPETDGGQLTYPIRPGVFRRLCEEARRNPSRRYVLIVDEINRGSLPRIFGELLYLLEYRDSQERVTLPYSGDRFNIPQNMYLIGTMNTADRSIALVDHALRRRFYFFALRPSPEILQAWLEVHNRETMVWVADLLKKLNQQLDEDHIEWHLHIGHSYFMVKDGALSEDRVALIWHHSIEPMLEEYFYKQPERRSRYQYEVLKASVTSIE